MMLLAQYTPQLITGVAVFVAIFTHYWLPKKFWQPCFIAAIVSTLVGFLFLFYAPISLPVNVDSRYQLAVKMSYFTLGSSFVLALLIGYLMKLMPKFFK